MSHDDFFKIIIHVHISGLANNTTNEKGCIIMVLIEKHPIKMRSLCDVSAIQFRRLTHV